MTKQEKITVPSHKNIHVALAAAQLEMGPLVKGAVNPHFKKTYADLASVVSASREALANNGISYHYEIRRDGEHTDMVTVFTHGETESAIECAVPLIVTKNDMQGMKSATTYAKRIGHESLSGLAPEDDDGNAAAKAAPKVQSVSPDQFIKLRDLAAEAGVDEVKVCQMANAPSLEQFPAERFQAAIRKLNATIEANAPSPAEQITEDEIPY